MAHVANSNRAPGATAWDPRPRADRRPTMPQCRMAKMPKCGNAALWIRPRERNNNTNFPMLPLPTSLDYRPVWVWVWVKGQNVVWVSDERDAESPTYGFIGIFA